MSPCLYNNKSHSPYNEEEEKKYRQTHKKISTLNSDFQSICPLSMSQNALLSVCLSVCLSMCSLLRYRLNVFLPPLPKVGCLIFLELRNPWGKVMKRSGLRFKHFLFGCGLKLPNKKKCIFLADFAYKTRWKPRFPMD